MVQQRQVGGFQLEKLIVLLHIVSYAAVVFTDLTEANSWATRDLRCNKEVVPLKMCTVK